MCELFLGRLLCFLFDLLVLRQSQSEDPVKIFPSAHVVLELAHDVAAAQREAGPEDDGGRLGVGYLTKRMLIPLGHHPPAGPVAVPCCRYAKAAVAAGFAKDAIDELWKARGYMEIKPVQHKENDFEVALAFIYCLIYLMYVLMIQIFKKKFSFLAKR